jgi:predicted Zn-dependent protease
MQNGTRAVTIAGSAGQAQFSGGRFNGDMGMYVQQVIRELTGGRTQVAMGPLQRTNINGLPAAYTVGRASTSSGAVDVGVMVYQWDANNAYHFVTLTRAGQGLTPFASMVDSVRRITPAEAAAIRPRVMDVVTVQRGDTAQSLSSRMAYRDFKLERFLSLNGLSANTALAPGQKVKLVVYGTRRS